MEEEEEEDYAVYTIYKLLQHVAFFRECTQRSCLVKNV
jgi:hypothetical protein